MYGLLICGLCLLVSAGLFHKLGKSSGSSDNANMMAIIRFTGNVSDFWSDLLFSIVLYVQQYWTLFYFSAVFVAVPYILSLVLAVYATEKWKYSNLDRNQRLSHWLDKHVFVIYGGTILAGFYSAVELAQSRLFYLDMFHLQLKKSEYAMLKNFRFFNTVILEVRYCGDSIDDIFSYFFVAMSCFCFVLEINIK